MGDIIWGALESLRNEGSDHMIDELQIRLEQLVREQGNSLENLQKRAAAGWRTTYSPQKYEVVKVEPKAKAINLGGLIVWI